MCWRWSGLQEFCSSRQSGRWTGISDFYDSAHFYNVVIVVLAAALSHLIYKSYEDEAGCGVDNIGRQRIVRK